MALKIPVGTYNCENECQLIVAEIQDCREFKIAKEPLRNCAEYKDDKLQYYKLSDLPVFKADGDKITLMGNPYPVVFARAERSVFIFEPSIMVQAKRDAESIAIKEISISEYLQDKENRVHKYIELIEPLDDYVEEMSKADSALNTVSKKAEVLGIKAVDAVQDYLLENPVRNTYMIESQTGEIKTVPLYLPVLSVTSYDVLSIYISAEIFLTALCSADTIPVIKAVQRGYRYSEQKCVIWVSEKWKMLNVAEMLQRVATVSKENRALLEFLYGMYSRGTLKCVGGETPSFRLFMDMLYRVVIKEENLADCLVISGTVTDSIVDGPGLRYVVFTQGCEHHCAGCHNPQTWGFEATENVKLLHYSEILKEIKSNPLITGVTLSGGDPVLQLPAVTKLVENIKKESLNIEDIILYTGYTITLEKQKSTVALCDIPSMIDYVIDGRFIQEKRNLDLLFRGSENQRIIDVKKSKEKHELVTIDNFD